MLKPNKDEIYLAMANKKMKVEDLSKASGVSAGTIYRIKKGYLSRPEYLGKIAQALEVNVVDIIIKEEDE